MGFLCVPQTIGLTRGEPKQGQRHRADGKKIAMELGDERASKSTSINRDLSSENVYYGYQSGAECWDALVADADAYRSNYVDKNGTERSRKLPKQAVVGIAVIVNPPNEVADTWTREQHDAFQADAAAVLAVIEPRLFGKEHCRMRADHFDEGNHAHYVYETVGVGSLYDARLRSRMAVQFAEGMRVLGWDMDTPTMTDWERYNDDPDYRAEIDAKRAGQGLSQPEHAAREAERLAQALDTASETLAGVSQAVESQERRLHDAEVAYAAQVKQTEEAAEEYRAMRRAKRDAKTGDTLADFLADEDAAVMVSGTAAEFPLPFVRKVISAIQDTYRAWKQARAERLKEADEAARRSAERSAKLAAAEARQREHTGGASPDRFLSL